MFDELIKALDSLGLEPGGSVSFAVLKDKVLTPQYEEAKRQGKVMVSPLVWNERMRCAGVLVMIREDLNRVGYDVIRTYGGAVRFVRDE